MLSILSMSAITIMCTTLCASSHRVAPGHLPLTLSFKQEKMDRVRPKGHPGVLSLSAHRATGLPKVRSISRCDNMATASSRGVCEVKFQSGYTTCSYISGFQISKENGYQAADLQGPSCKKLGSHRGKYSQIQSSCLLLVNGRQINDFKHKRCIQSQAW